METIRIPHSSPSRGAMTWALLVRRISPRSSRGLRIFEGTHLKTGSQIEESELRPTERYPLVPLVIEFAGSTGRDARGRPARGHNRSTHLHILWRYDARVSDWQEIIRTVTEGADWFVQFEPIVRRELVRPPANYAEEARTASERLIVTIDRELHELDADEARESVLAFLYDQIVARLVADFEEPGEAPAESLPERKPVGRELRPAAETEGTGND